MNITGGVEPPAWLQKLPEENRRAGAGLGDLLGTGLAAGLKWATQDPTEIDPATGQPAVDPLTGTPGKQSFWTFFQEARLNQENPLWSLKAEKDRAGILQAGIAVKGAQAELAQKNSEWRLQHDEIDQRARWGAMSSKARQQARESGTAPVFKSRDFSAWDEKLQQNDNLYDWREQANAINQQKVDNDLTKKQMQVDEQAKKLEAEKARWEADRDAKIKVEQMRGDTMRAVQELRNKTKDLTLDPVTKQQLSNMERQEKMLRQRFVAEPYGPTRDELQKQLDDLALQEMDVRQKVVAIQPVPPGSAWGAPAPGAAPASSSGGQSQKVGRFTVTPVATP